MNSDITGCSEDPNDLQSAQSIGALRGEVWLAVQTYQAQSLLRGRRGSEDKPAITGLLGFADRLKLLWQAARQDDPYADWWLIKVEEAIAQCRTQLNGVSEQLNALLDSECSLEISVAESSRPQRIALQFANPYAFRAAQMLADYDRLVCTSMTLRHTGFDIPEPLREQADGSGRWVRRVFALPQGYHFYDIARSDVLQGTQKALKAREVMGLMPEDVMSGVQVPSLRPRSPEIRVGAVNTDTGQQD